MDISPITGSAAAARIAAAKTPEPVARIESPEPSASPASPRRSAHHASQDQSGQKPAPSSATVAARPPPAHQPPQQKESAQNHGPRDGIRRRPPYLPRQRRIQCDVLGRRDRIAQRIG